MNSHPMQMSLSKTGWSIDPELLDEIAIELIHSEQFGDTLKLKLQFKNGSVDQIEADLKDGEGLKVYDALQEGIGSRKL